MAPFRLFLTFAAAIPAIAASQLARPFDDLKEQANRQAHRLQVDLGYSIYEGTTNSSTRLNIFRGIRYADAPIGNLRWQAPQPPSLNRSSVIPANSFPFVCPQSAPSGVIWGSLLPASEDCLFLNVYAPQNASNLPILVWIHGGGYGAGDGTQDLSAIINANDDGFIGISIQYRLGAFGFLAGDEMYENGVLNAGLLDQQLALQWVQAYAELFGGDPGRVTISGQSAGGGSVMLHDIAYGGTLGTSLFANSISASPYMPQQYRYNDQKPSQAYKDFATAAGCSSQELVGSNSKTIFQCLVCKDSQVLQKASALVSGSGIFGSWAFLPVTDGTLIQSTPSQALHGQLNGINHLSGSNAEEAFYFVQPNITTTNSFLDWIHLVFPLFTEGDISTLLEYYPSLNLSAEEFPRFATSGNTGLTALDVSQSAVGSQQRANNLYAETTFLCPSYWLAEAYTRAGNGQRGWKYQYSVPNSAHGADITAYFGPSMPNQGPDFVLAFQRIWGNFIIYDNPSISSTIANGARANGADRNPLDNWPVFSREDQRMANLNQTGGTLAQAVGTNFTIYTDPGLLNNLSLVDGYGWEGTRRRRCDFWESVWNRIPE